MRGDGLSWWTDPKRYFFGGFQRIVSSKKRDSMSCRRVHVYMAPSLCPHFFVRIIQGVIHHEHYIIYCCFVYLLSMVHLYLIFTFFFVHVDFRIVTTSIAFSCPSHGTSPSYVTRPTPRVSQHETIGYWRKRRKAYWVLTCSNKKMTIKSSHENCRAALHVAPVWQFY